MLDDMPDTLLPLILFPGERVQEIVPLGLITRLAGVPFGVFDDETVVYLLPISSNHKSLNIIPIGY